MASARVLRLAGAAALVAAALPLGASTPAAASWPGGNGDVFAVQYDGTDTSIVRLDANGQIGGTVGGNLTEFSNFATDADGERLVYSRGGDIVMVDLETAEETPITSGEAVDTDPAFSFDGRYLVYVSNADGDQDIYMRDLTDPGFTPVNLTNNEADDWAPAFGNDGTGHGDLIAYVSLEGSDPNSLDSDVWTVAPDGTGKTNLTNNNDNDFGPNWHPSFDMLAYSSQDDAGRDQIHTMSWDGTGKDQLTTDANFNYEPAWSPDGTKIAFTKQPAGINSVGRIFVMPGEPGNEATPLSPASTTVGFDRADWQAGPGCEVDCEPPGELQPVLFLNLRKHVVVSGGVEGPGDTTGGTCGVGTPIQIQRYSKGRFRTIADVTTNENGTFSRKVADRTGRYRLRSTQFTDEANGTTCLAATSPARVHRHRR
ncbi:MAG TPA: hypothetical protein VHN37_15355 [Actinomycetota bacterium]|nr:hypothetical protein [Actinomycetota bacterium]